MKYFIVALALVFIGMVMIVHSIVGNVHTFSDNECVGCHLDVAESPSELKPMTVYGCVGCHEDSIEKKLHPIVVMPRKSIPADMPLVNGVVTCVTCHFVHPFSIKSKKYTYALLRRPGRGPVFCSACHGIDTKGHILFENAHKGSYVEIGRNKPLDIYSLQCIECHLERLTLPKSGMGAGRWEHSPGSKKNHLMGVSYLDAFARNPKDYRSPGSIPPEMRLFDGKIGCGTCHNIYTRAKNMLSVDNKGSRLCLVCHIK